MKQTPQVTNKIAAISRAMADHYVWGEACDGWHMVRDSALSVIEESMPPGAHEVRHYHEKAQQFFYILSGEATMEANGETIMLRAGEGIRILPGVRHQIRNESSDAIRFLVISQPPSHGDRVTE
jgi:mannose-6-phosphate isomerase-like protein (cupin superfamily)